MSAPEITVIDYGVGNLLSVQRGLEHCGAKVLMTSDPQKVVTAGRVVLPGVGAFANAMQALRRLGMDAAVREVVARGTPLLGICLGMQLLLDESEEFGIASGLGVIPGRVIPVPTRSLSGEVQKIPHIGWNGLHPTGRENRWMGTLLEDNKKADAAYFVHSFMSVTAEPSFRIAHCLYGGHEIPAVIGRDQVTGCQFHPEKSGSVGLKMLKRFCL